MEAPVSTRKVELSLTIYPPCAVCTKPYPGHEEDHEYVPGTSKNCPDGQSVELGVIAEGVI